jgi:hypothetical protein
LFSIGNLLINYVKLTTTEANITNYCHIGIAKHLSAQHGYGYYGNTT